jgi:hypothetical protein
VTGAVHGAQPVQTDAEDQTDPSISRCSDHDVGLAGQVEVHGLEHPQSAKLVIAPTLEFREEVVTPLASPELLQLQMKDSDSSLVLVEATAVNVAVQRPEMHVSVAVARVDHR